MVNFKKASTDDLFVNPNQETVDFTDFLDMFEDEEERISGYPSLQALTHIQKSTSKIKQQNPWGFFLPADAAELINFHPDAEGKHWKAITFYSSDETAFNDGSLDYESIKDEPGLQTHKGFISTGFSFHIVQASSTEIYEIVSMPDQPNRYRFVDLKWRNGSMTPAADLLKERTDDNRPTHRWVKRYLIKIVDKFGKPLHDGFVQYRAHGGAGGAFGFETSQYLNNLAKVYSQAKGKRVQPGPKFRSLCRLGMAFGLIKMDSSTIAYLDPITVTRVYPNSAIHLENGKEDRVEMVKRDKKPDLKVLKKLLGEVCVHKDSELGQELLAGVEEHSEYANPPNNQNSDEANAPVAPKTQTIQGMIAKEMVVMQQDGSSKVSIDTGEAFISFTVPMDKVAILDCEGRVEVTIEDETLVNFKSLAAPEQPAMAGATPAATPANFQDEDF